MSTIPRTRAKSKLRPEIVAGPIQQPTINEKVQSELEQVASKHRGVLPAQAVVDWARSHPRSELHKRFTWEDGEAADKWRLWEARVLIARVTIEPRPERTVRAWVNLPSDRAGERPAYRATVRVMSNAEQRAELLQSVKDELGRLRRKYAELTELASVWDAVDKSTRS